MHGCDRDDRVRVWLSARNVNSITSPMSASTSLGLNVRLPHAPTVTLYLVIASVVVLAVGDKQCVLEATVASWRPVCVLEGGLEYEPFVH